MVKSAAVRSGWWRSCVGRSCLVQGTLMIALLLGSELEMPPALAESAAAYRSRGLMERDQGRWSEAIASLQKSVELEPQNLSGRVTLGWTLHLAGQDQAAATALQQTLAIDPFYVPALNALGIIYLVNDDLAGAVVTHSWATLLAPDNEIPHYNLSLAFQRLQHYDWAIVAAEKAIALEPDNPHPLVALAIAHWGNQDQTLAQQDFQRAIALDSRYRSSSFLPGLKTAGFSPNQIAIAQQVAANLQQRY